jgi:hypothetical protein
MERNSTSNDVQGVENRCRRPRPRLDCLSRFSKTYYHRSGEANDARSVSGGTGDNTTQVDVGDPMTTTKLRDEIVSALQRGALHSDLLNIVLRHKSHGVSQRTTYDTLQAISIELGCNKDENEEHPQCETLGDLMDRVWGFCPVRDAIWDSSLSEATIE